jgi:hypothetical protein
MNINEYQFEALFQPIFDENQTWAKEDLPANHDINRMWTMIEGDNEHTFIIPGVHRVNSMYYIETITPWDRDDYTVYCECPCDSEDCDYDCAVFF